MSGTSLLYCDGGGTGDGQSSLNGATVMPWHSPHRASANASVTLARQLYNWRARMVNAPSPPASHLKAQLRVCRTLSASSVWRPLQLFCFDSKISPLPAVLSCRTKLLCCGGGRFIFRRSHGCPRR